MCEIRKVNPDAQLVQTEDLGKTQSTPRLAYQARFENDRRWLSLDLLCGRVDAAHPLRPYLRRSGIDDATMDVFLESPCPPDVVGINHYLTSERFLDERLEPYPVEQHGDNGRDVYADVEAVRVCAQLAGWRTLLREAWERYRLPLAITEAHLGCTREEQMRWLLEAWRAAEHLRDEGGDVRAVTVWALLGSYDWNSLCVRDAGFYEPGVFDLRAPTPRPTAVAQVIRQLAAEQQPDHPVLDMPGWWRRPERLFYADPPGRTEEAA
jgi:dTDP-4-dehydrorhamnose reductase